MKSENESRKISLTKLEGEDFRNSSEWFKKFVSRCTMRQFKRAGKLASRIMIV